MRHVGVEPKIGGFLPPKMDGLLVGGFNPFENSSQNGNLPQIGVKKKNLWNHHLVYSMENPIKIDDLGG